MRIDSFGSLSEPLAASSDPSDAKQAAVAAGSSGDTALPGDTTNLSANALSVAALSSQALSAASQMEARVSALREAVSNGEYTLQPTQIAEAMLSEGI